MIGKQVLRIAYFTGNGRLLKDKLRSSLSCCIIEEKPEDFSLNDWISDSFDLHLPLLFIGSVGIAVRSIAPFISDKLLDPPVIVVDELGLNVIPVLSGHFGGANELAKEIAKSIDSHVVITTATDINNVFAVDVFARKNGLKITNRELIKKINSKALTGAETNITETEDCIEVEGLKLVPKRMILGMGCKKGKSFDDLFDFLNEIYDERTLFDKLYAIATIDAKEDEIGLIKLAQYYGAKFLVYSAEELEAVEGDFDESDFVKDTVGVGNVCERAALKAAGENGILVQDKIAKDGITLAEAKRVELDIDWN